MANRIIGIDISLNCSGCCVFDGESTTFHAFIKSGTVPKKTILEAIQKNIIVWEHSCPIEQIENIMKIICATDEIFIEGWSYNSNSSSSLSLAEIHGMIKFALHKFNIIPVSISPKSVKKYFCGNGNSDKKMMVDRFNLYNPGAEFPEKKPFNDVADAYAIAMCGQNSLFINKD